MIVAGGACDKSQQEMGAFQELPQVYPYKVYDA